VPRTLYTARFDTAELIQRGRTEQLACRTYRAGAVAAPTQLGSTISIYDDSGDAVVSAAAVTVVSSVATYSLLGSVTDDLELANRWRVAWSLVMGDGVTHVFENRAVLCRRTPSPVITEASLYARVPALNPSHAVAITARADFADSIDDAWFSLINRLVEGGKRLELVTDPTTLREAHLTLTLARVFDDLAARINPSYGETATQYRREYEAAYGALVLPTDEDDDGDADDIEPARGPIWAM
jgi:hypothetical protein